MKLQEAIIKGSILLDNTLLNFQCSKLRGDNRGYKEYTTLIIFNFWISFKIDISGKLIIITKNNKQISDKITLPLYEKIKEVVSKEQLIFVNI